ncbi:MAG: hypothetical protein RLZZ156_1635 [Deinococcota bacterium]|jgi:hypothetical protein
MQTVTLDEALDFVERLPRENWQTLVSIIQKRDFELRRDEIARNIEFSRAEFAQGKLKAMSANDFLGEASSKS